MKNRCSKKNCIYHDCRDDMEYPCALCTNHPLILKKQNYFIDKGD